MNWEERLTPFDHELFVMVRALTGNCEVKYGGTHYFIVVGYGGHDADYISAVMDAIAGRVGERLIRMTDDPDNKRFIVHIGFSKEKYPALIYARDNVAGDPSIGNPYYDNVKDCRIWALEVTRENVKKLIVFVGNGEMEIERRPDGKATFHFINANGSVYAHAPEYSFIVYVSPGHYTIMDKGEFYLKFRQI